MEMPDGDGVSALQVVSIEVELPHVCQAGCTDVTRSYAVRILISAHSRATRSTKDRLSRLTGSAAPSSYLHPTRPWCPSLAAWVESWYSWRDHIHGIRAGRAF
jgi:hypothetical protein